MSFSLTTTQQLNEWYDKYREDEIVFTKDIIRYLHMDPRQIYIKCQGAQWPCIINSTSFMQAKIIIGTQGGAYQQITRENAPAVNLRYCFIEPDGNPLVFFVTCHVSEKTPYMNSHDLAVVTLTFTQRPPDDLIAKLGMLIDANQGFLYRKEERIFINDETKRLLGLDKKESIIYVQNVPRRCILFNLSFSGAKIVILGIPKFLKDKECVVRIMFSDPNEVVDIKGTIVSANSVENRKELAEAGIKFDEATLPLAYKMRINDYLSNKNKRFMTAMSAAGEKKEAAETDESKDALAQKVAQARAANQAANAAADAKRAAEEEAQRAKRISAQQTQSAAESTEAVSAPEAEKTESAQ